MHLPYLRLSFDQIYPRHAKLSSPRLFITHGRKELPDFNRVFRIRSTTRAYR
jgi:hypothetical protein